MVDRLDKDTIENYYSKGYLHIRSTVTIIGRPKEHIEDTLSKYLEKLFEDNSIVSVQVDLFEAKESETNDGFYECFAEFEALFETLDKVTQFVMNYLPGTIEFIYPQKLEFSNLDVNTMFTNLLLKFHQVDRALKGQILENKKLKKEANIEEQN